MNDLIKGELEVIEQFIRSDSIVFDVGGCQGEWSGEVLKRGLAKCVHVFEPVQTSYNQIFKNLQMYEDKVVLNLLAASDTQRSDVFWEYVSHPTLSTKYKRNEQVMLHFGIQNPTQIEVETISLDTYCMKNSISHIDFLKIDVEGAELDVLQGACELLSTGRIKHLQFEYGGCFLDAGITLKMIYDFLSSKRYKIGIMLNGIVQYLSCFDIEMENYEYCNYVGVYDGLLI